MLMDCQGTGDNQQSSPTLDNAILFLGLQMANVQILNVKSQMQSDDLERLKVRCQHYYSYFDSVLLNYFCPTFVNILFMKVDTGKKQKVFFHHKPTCVATIQKL